jgi:hypothetical protein
MQPVYAEHGIATFPVGADKKPGSKLSTLMISRLAYSQRQMRGGPSQLAVQP